MSAVQPVRGVDEVLACAVVGGLVRQLAPMFAVFPEWGRADLVAHAMMAVRAAWPTYDPARAAPSTFVYRVARCELLDLARGLSRRLRRERSRAVPAVDRRSDPAAALAGIDADDDLAGWCSSNYRAARHTFGPRRFRVGRRFMNLATTAALLLLIDRLNLSGEAALDLLDRRPDIRLALRLRHTPTIGYLVAVRRLRSRVHGRRRSTV